MWVMLSLPPFLPPARGMRSCGKSKPSQIPRDTWKSGMRIGLKFPWVHGPFNTDEYLASLAFSPSETSLLYIAEAKPSANNDDPYQRFRFIPQFGEGIAGKKQPTIFIIRLSTERGQTHGPILSQYHHRLHCLVRRYSHLIPKSMLPGTGTHQMAACWESRDAIIVLHSDALRYVQANAN